MKNKKEYSANTYTPKERNMYLLGLAGQNMIYNIIATGMAYYFQSVIFIPQIAIGIFMAVARVWDAINDPMMGTIVDKTRSKWGKCRPYLFFVPPVVMITTILTFVNGQYLETNSAFKNTIIIAWAAISYILWGMSYTAGDIPIWGITSLMSESEKDRSALMGLARIAAAIGGGVVLVSIQPVSQILANRLNESGMSYKNALQAGFIIVAIVLTVIGSGLFECAAYAKERVRQPSDEKKGFKESFKIMWNCKPFRRILIAGVLRAPTNILSLVAMTLLSYYYGDNSANGQSYVLYMIILGGGMFLGMFAAMALVPKVSEKIEKKTIINVCSIAAAVPFVAIFVAFLIDETGLMKGYWLAILSVLFAVAGASTGAFQVLQTIMIADCIDYDEYRTGYRPDGVFFSGQSFIVKLGAGISSIIQSVIFAIVGFSDANIMKVNEILASSPADDFCFATNPDFHMYRLGMFLLVSIPSAIGFVLSVIPMLGYEISNEEHKKILDELNAKRNSQAQ